MPKKNYPILPADPNIAVDYLETPYTVTTTSLPSSGSGDDPKDDPKNSRSVLNPQNQQNSQNLKPTTNTAFYRYLMPKDGDCGYHSLGIPRATIVKQLYDSAADPIIRDMIGAEIEVALHAGDLPKAVNSVGTQPTLLDLKTDFLASNKALDKALISIKQSLSSHYPKLVSTLSCRLDSLTVDEMLKFLEDKCKESASKENDSNPSKKNLSKYKKTLGDLYAKYNRWKEEISKKSRTVDVFVAYIKHYIAVPGKFLTFLPDVSFSSHAPLREPIKGRSSLDAIAKINHLHLRVWGLVDRGSSSSLQLKLLHQFGGIDSNQPASAARVARIVNLLYQDAHFDSLQLQPGLSVKPVITQLWEDRQLNTGDGLQANGDFQLNQWMQTKLHFGNHSSTESGIVTTISSLPSANESNLSKPTSDMSTRLQNAEEALAKFLEGESARVLEEDAPRRQRIVETTKRVKAEPAELVAQTSKKEQEDRKKITEKKAGAEMEAEKLASKKTEINKATTRQVSTKLRFILG